MSTKDTIICFSLSVAIYLVAKLISDSFISGWLGACVTVGVSIWLVNKDEE